VQYNEKLNEDDNIHHLWCSPALEVNLKRQLGQGLS
jgi:hypothetical protein